MIRLGVFAVVAGICCFLSGCSGNSSAPEMNETSLSTAEADWGGDEADGDVEMALDVPDPDDL